jgi:hypothetical protein
MIRHIFLELFAQKEFACGSMSITVISSTARPQALQPVEITL